MDGKARAKLVAKLDKEGRWFQKAVRHYRTREWVRDMRRALGIGLAALGDETQVSRKTLYLAEEKEETGAITIAELEALAAAMECKLVYAIVPEQGTVAELAERRKEHPRKTRTQREKEDKEYKEWYALEVERMRSLNQGGDAIEQWRGELSQQRAERIAREGLAAERHEVVVRPPGAQRIRNAIAGAVAELGPEGKEAIRRAAGGRD
jgi:transcriptional regulator with XRE-family HTH domain